MGAYFAGHWLPAALALGKALFVVLVFLQVALLLTWADRRQGAMIQDRVGPHRAVIWMPTAVAQGALFVPALLVSALFGWWAYRVWSLEPDGRLPRAVTYSQLGIFMTWVTGLVITGAVRRRGVRSSFDRFCREVIGDPRKFFWGGLAAHAAAFVALNAFSDEPQVTRLFFGGGVGVFCFGVLGGAYYAVSQMQGDRVGLRLAGLLHGPADGLKTIFKEDIIPPTADRFLHSLAPMIAFFPVLTVLAVVPFGDTLCFGLRKDGGLDLLALARSVPRDGMCAEGAVQLQVVDLNVGILFFFALAGTGVVGAALAGWASDNKYSLLGGLRAASQMVSYEVTLGLTLIGALMVYGTVQIDHMVRWQIENSWGIFVQPLAFFLFFAAAVAETKRIPFDLPEGESELVAGYFTEYAGMKFAMFFFGEYIGVVTSSCLMATIFFGGWHIPFVYRDGISVAFGDTVIFRQTMAHGGLVAVGVLAYLVKVLALCWLQLMVRWTLPRFRYDQLMALGWRKLLPASLVNILATGVVILLAQSAGPSMQRALGVAGDVTEAVVAVALLAAAIALVRLLLTPTKHRELIASTSARYAAIQGGTRSARLGA